MSDYDDDDPCDCWECGSDLVDVQLSPQMRLTVIQCTDCDLRREYKYPEETAVRKWNREARSALSKAKTRPVTSPKS